MASSTDDITHLLRRTEFVARPARVSALTPLDLSAAVDDVLNVGLNPADTLPPFLQAHNENMTWEQFVASVHWWIDRMVDVPRPVQEKMTLFWHGHFVSGWEKVFRTDAMLSQNRLYRQRALGDLRLLAQAMAIEPAMLLYLDNAESVKGNENQNFARELLELFLLGVGNYAESDVEAAAKAWTGHNLDWNTYRYVFRPGDHDTAQKTFFGTTRDWNGPDIIDHVLRDNPSTRAVAARFISKKLWEFFAYQGPSADLVNALADGFITSGLDIRSLLRAILLHPEFYSQRARQGMVRSPIDYVVALMEATGHRCATLHPEWFFEDMGQVPFNPPNVSGWRLNGYWVNSATFGGRASIARHATWSMREDGGFDHLKQLTVPAAIAEMATMFRLVPLSSTTDAALTTWLQGERSVEPWGGWWQPTNLLTMSMLTPEFHVA